MLLNDLWDKATKFGKPSLSMMDDGTIMCRITFFSRDRVGLVAKSRQGHTSPLTAIGDALAIAEMIKADEMFHVTNGGQNGSQKAEA